MFSGIIEIVGRVEEIEQLPSGIRLDLATGLTLSLGESLAVNGVCLTVSQIKGATQSFFVSSETLALTNLRGLGVDSVVNLERSLRPQDRMSGHWVQGHIEGQGEILELKPIGEDRDLVLRIPRSLMKYCVHKGSICVNGVSLTINHLEDRYFENGDGKIAIRLVPHTIQNTQFCASVPGESVNIETDVLAKYVERIMDAKQI